MDGRLLIKVDQYLHFRGSDGERDVGDGIGRVGDGHMSNWSPNIQSEVGLCFGDSDELWALNYSRSENHEVIYRGW